MQWNFCKVLSFLIDIRQLFKLFYVKLMTKLNAPIYDKNIKIDIKNVFNITCSIILTRNTHAGNNMILHYIL